MKSQMKVVGCIADESKNEKTVADYMELCLLYDMDFSYDTEGNDMYILHKSLKDGEYTQLYFSQKDFEMTSAYMDWDGEVLEFSEAQEFYKILEEVRTSYLQQIYAEYGLIEHPRDRLKRRGNYKKIVSCLKAACRCKGTIEYSGNIIKLVIVGEDQPVSRIAIAIERGTYKMGALRKQGITINIPDYESMIMILKDLES